MIGKKYTLFDVINTAVMLIVFGITLYPILYVFSVSLSTTAHILNNDITIYPRGFNLEAYKMIFETPKIPRSYANSLFYTTLGVFINLTMTAIIAYPLSRKELAGRKFYILLIVTTMFINGGLIPNYLFVKNLGMINTVWALVIPNAIWTYELLIVKSYYESMSEELHEAAVIDGASEFLILFRIMIPLAKPVLASVALFFSLTHWNSFFTPMIYLNDIEKMPLQVVLKEMLILDTAKPSSNIMEYANMTPEALKNATIVVSMVPMLLLYPFIQKFFVKGMMVGAVKG